MVRIWSSVLLGVTLAGCGAFNRGLSASDRLIVSSSAGNFLKVYSVNATTGGLTLQTTVSITSPSALAVHPSEGTVFVSKNNATIECYQFDFRRGTGPTSVSSVSVTNVVSIAVANDGKTIMYGRTGQNFIYWRTISGCDMGSESSVASGSGQIDQIIPSSDSTFAIAATSGSRIYRFNRSTTSGALTLSTSKALVSGMANSQAMTTDDQFVVASNGAGVDSYRASDFTTVSNNVGTSIAHAAVAVGSDKVVILRTGVDHWGASLSSTGVITAGASANYGLGDFDGGVAYSPTRSFFYIGDQTNSAVWVHKTTSTSPFSGTPTQVNVGNVPSAIAYVPGWS